jgi:molecular chaperone DnaK (HSP70)
MPPSFAIDFGTTNTRIAYYDGQRLQMVPLVTEVGSFIQYPSQVSYQDGAAVAFGPEAREQLRGTLLPHPMKWLLGGDEPVEVEKGVLREPVQIVADFFRHLRRLVGESIKQTPLDRVALTIPVHYSPRARQQLKEACQEAGITVTHFFFEPIAAIYCSLMANRVAGVAGVFDWGGGSLDIATVQIRDNMALTRQIDGWHRGGVDFDRLICEQAVDDWLVKNPMPGYTTDTILNRTRAGRELRLRAEASKIQLSNKTEAAITYSAFLGKNDMNFRLRRQDFNELIASDIASATCRLELALKATGISPGVLARLFLSGGTCHIPAVRDHLAAQIAGHKIVTTLRLPDRLRSTAAPVGLDDIGNATALGAALLAVHGAEPVFASAIGVRLADASGDQFFPVYKANETVPFMTREVRLFVSDASAGVARLLICDQNDSALQPGGRLLRVLSIPIDPSENYLEVKFTLDQHLVLCVEATGVKAIARSDHKAWIQHLNLGFRIPPEQHA